MFGLSVMAVGVWAWTEKNAFNNLSKLTHLALDPAFALILIGKLYIYLLKNSDVIQKFELLQVELLL